MRPDITGDITDEMDCVVDTDAEPREVIPTLAALLLSIGDADSKREQRSSLYDVCA